MVEDIERNGYCFTDGCGNINPALALLIAREHRLKKCCTFQIRIGGAKGIVMIKDSLLEFEGVLSSLSDDELR